MKYKTVGIEDLAGLWLDYVIAGDVCELDTNISWLPGGYSAELTVNRRGEQARKFSPSTLWADAGPLIDSFRISLLHNDDAQWTATIEGGQPYTHHQPLVAAMRALALYKVKGGFTVQTYS